MVKFLQREHTYKHPWEIVSLAFWRKYPNPYSPHVLSVDVYDRKVDPTTGILHTTRVICASSTVPSYIESVVGTPYLYAIETSTVDPVKKTMVMHTRNITYNSFMEVEETCTYSVDPKNPNWTNFKQEAKISAFMPLLSGKVEGWSVSSFLQNASKGLQAMEELCQSIRQEMPST